MAQYRGHIPRSLGAPSDAADHSLVPSCFKDLYMSMKSPDLSYTTENPYPDDQLMVDDAPDEDWVQGSDVQYNDNNGRIPRSCTTSEIHASTHTKDDRRRGARPHQRPHYAIEKRYRANINSNFEELRQCLVDARSFLDLESTSERGSGSSSSEYSRSDEQQQEAMKMSKTKVLSEAVDYIHFLEALNDRATEHIQLLENQLGVCQKESLR